MNNEIKKINTNEDVPPEVIEYLIRMEDTWIKEIKEGKTYSIEEVRRRLGLI